ncbi:MAG: valine--tRNA ligase [Bacillota bacterium]
MCEKNLGTVYDPSQVEDRLYDFWLEKNYFHGEVDKTGQKEPFSVVIPPPNVTANLHIGHALDNALQDIIVRFNRMNGKNTTWIPGTDHAGIATQIKVEQMLRETENITRHDLGREEFLIRVWAWKEKYGSTIINQLKKLGSSCDWERERFTMDEGCSRAVREVFVRLYEKGLIYQGDYIINWCPSCNTALSDVEVEHVDKDGSFWHLRYPLVDGSGYIEIATTRPETMLGDTAVAVHPDDERYADLVGKEVILPLVGRQIPIIADEYVDPEFGTGVVKITPGHDPNDFEVGRRHDLPIETVIGFDAIMTEAAGKYKGLDRYEARKQVLADLEAGGYLVKVVDTNHAVSTCYRCDTVIEPLVSKQWFVKMEPLAKPAIKAVKEGKIKFYPERFAKLYLNWVENVRDWCISRQLWWGHRIPVWYCDDCDEVIVAKEDPTKCPKCGSENLTQDPDVLDTWFSSALWPFSTMGFPEKTEELKYFYPTSVLVTGFDIIYFWVARMVFMGIEFMGEIPFRDVYIHGLVRDHLGRKMSKSLGNGIDPLEVISEYGADALRFTLVNGVAPGNDMRFHLDKVEASRNFMNKIWNASRFALMHLEDTIPEKKEPKLLANRWFLTRLKKVSENLTRDLENYDTGEGARLLYDFVWGEFCDWFIELSKPALYGNMGQEAKEETCYVLWLSLDTILKMLHPYVPFITEEIWQTMPHSGDSIMVSNWPGESLTFSDEKAERGINELVELITKIRNIRAELGVAPGKEIRILYEGNLLEEQISYLKALAKAQEVLPIEGTKPEKAVTAVVSGVTAYLPLQDMIDLDKESARIKKEIENMENEIKRAQSKLNNQGFVAKAPKEVVEKEQEKLKDYEIKREKLVVRLKELI